MKNQGISLIFDVDGTLLNSYDSIVKHIEETLAKCHFSYPKEEIYRFVIKTSTLAFFQYVAIKEEADADELFRAYQSIKKDIDSIPLMPYVVEMLEECKNQGINCFVYTHRGQSVYDIFSRLGITKYFIEIVDSSKNFARKPSGDAIEYLIYKYQLDRNNTYYVGDREIDIRCAENGHIKSIFYNSSGIELNSKGATHVIKDFRELKKVL